MPQRRLRETYHLEADSIQHAYPLVRPLLIVKIEEVLVDLVEQCVKFLCEYPLWTLTIRWNRLWWACIGLDGTILNGNHLACVLDDHIWIVTGVNVVTQWSLNARSAPSDNVVEPPCCRLSCASPSEPRPFLEGGGCWCQWQASLWRAHASTHAVQPWPAAMECRLVMVEWAMDSPLEPNVMRFLEQWPDGSDFSLAWCPCREHGYLTTHLCEQQWYGSLPCSHHAGAFGWRPWTSWDPWGKENPHSMKRNIIPLVSISRSQAIFYTAKPAYLYLLSNFWKSRVTTSYP